MTNRHKLIKNLLISQKNSLKKFIISDNIKIYCKYDFIVPSYMNHINNIHGRIFGFSIDGNKYFNEKYLNTSRSKTIWSGSEPKSMTFKETYEREGIYLPQNVKGAFYYLDVNTYFPVKYVSNENLQFISSSLYTCNNLICFDPSMQLHDLIHLYLNGMSWQDKSKFIKDDLNIKGSYVPFNKENDKKFKEKFIDIFYNPLPTDGMPLIVKDIKELGEFDYK